MEVERDSPQVCFPPPLLALSCVFVGASLQWVYPIRFAPDSLRWVLSGLLIGVGLGTILYCAWKFKKAGTSIEPWKKTSKIITSGIYRFTRNPIYLSFSVIGTGISFAANSAWILLMMFPLVLLLTRFVIAKEERYLEASFGEEYLSYKRKVRRWL